MIRLTTQHGLLIQQLTFYWRFYRVVDMTLNRRTFTFYVIVCYTVYFEELVEKLDDRLKFVKSDLFELLTITARKLVN